MFDGHHDMWGMYWGWWVFWLTFILIVVLALSRGLRGRTQQPETRADTPLDSLKRRYAAGDITTEEYEERKDRLIHSFPDSQT